MNIEKTGLVDEAGHGTQLVWRRHWRCHVKKVVLRTRTFKLAVRGNRREKRNTGYRVNVCLSNIIYIKKGN